MLVSFSKPIVLPNARNNPQPLCAFRWLSETKSNNAQNEWHGIDTRRTESMAKITADPSTHSHSALKAAYLFWLGKFSVESAAKKGNHDKTNLINARKILDYYYHEKQNPKLLEDLVCDNSQALPAPNRGFVRLINLVLQPLEGTRAFTQRARHQRGNASKASNAEMIDALREASEIAAMMQKCHDDRLYSKLVPDVNSQRGLLNLWYKRCRFLAHLQNDQSWNPSQYDEKLSLSLGGARSSRGCITIIDQIVQDMEQSKSITLSPDASCYVFQFTARAAGRLPGGAEESLKLFEKLRKRKPAMLSDSIDDVKPICTSILSAFANEVEASVGNNSATSAILQRTFEWWDSMKQYDFMRDPFVYSSLMNVCSKAGDARKTKEILDEMLSQGVKVTTIHFNIALNACTFGSSVSVDEVEAILRQMVEMHQSGMNTKPDRITYTSVILAFLRSSSKDGIAKAEEMLESLENVENGRESLIDSQLYTEFLGGLLFRQERAHEPQEREALALKMENVFTRLCARGELDKNFRGPTIKDLNHCLKGWARSRSRTRTDRLVRLFNKWRQECHRKVDASTYRFMLLGLSSSFSPEMLHYGKFLIRQMEEDKIPLHIGVMNQYARLLARFGEDGEAESYIESREKMYSDKQSDVPPEENTYRYILEEYWKKGDVHRAHLLFQRLKALGHDRPDFRPSEKSYAAMIHAWTKSKDVRYLKNVEQLFAEVRSLFKPSSYIYAAYQIAWRNSGRQDAPIKVEAILNEMQQNYASGKNPNCRPSTFNFSHVINSWAQVGGKESAERAGAILEQLETLYDHSGALDPLRPTEACYQGVIKAWSTVTGGEAGKEALAILDRMTKRHLVSSLSPLPSATCYHLVMDAFRSDAGENCIEDLASIYERMKVDYRCGNQYAKPNAETYLTIFNHCSLATSTTTEAGELTSIALSDITATDELNKNIQLYASYISCLSMMFQHVATRSHLLQEAMNNFPDFVRDSEELQALLSDIQTDHAAVAQLTRCH
ncbi:hypothetical protein FisN_5Lh189 [Fistulifera solaris]|uniref:PROP1-like PPR domain-containing protein n=1 Tax=Fistulifera solaris TaxID=1519565 RepID=A0A1Z5JIR9_FISSO|nr:hypothetical protein FisN_5Lh189 [Fistulifera solaris]|eukprot:GAX13910.1 hypothetical protein FisN_5Lh189 [Fistulifera solaris]